MKPPEPARRAGSQSGTGNPSDEARRRRIAGRRSLHDSRVLIWEHAETQPLAERLTHFGCTVVCTRSIDEAIAMHGAQPFDLLFASPGAEHAPDVGVLHLLRRALPKIALVLISGEASVAVRLRCQELRPQYFATPPFEDAELREILRLTSSQRPSPRQG